MTIQAFKMCQNGNKKVFDQCAEIPTVLVQTKSDLKESQEYPDEEVNEVASSLSTKLFLTSAKDDTNVTEVFEYLADLFLSNRKTEKSKKKEEVTVKPGKPTVTLASKTAKDKEKGGKKKSRSW